MICSICKKNPAVIFSSKIENNKRTMEGLCLECAKKQGINTDEILSEQNKAFIESQAKDMNKQLENLFKGLSENLEGIDGLEIGDLSSLNYNDDSPDSDDEEFNDNPPKILAGAIPLGSIFGNFNNMINKNQNKNSNEQSSSNNTKKL